MADVVIAPDLRELYERIKRSTPQMGWRFALPIIERVSKAEQENVALRAERDELAYWKKEQLAVEATWDDQAVGKELGVPWGAIIRAEILPRIKALRAKIAKLEAPISNEEWLDLWNKEMLCGMMGNEAATREGVDALIAARGREGE